MIMDNEKLHHQKGVLSCVRSINQVFLWNNIALYFAAVKQQVSIRDCLRSFAVARP
jgi:hypothetical protein